MQFTHETSVALNGTYSLKYYMEEGGSAILEMQDGAEPWTEIEYTGSSISTNKTFTFSGNVRAILSNGARLYYDPVGA